MYPYNQTISKTLRFDLGAYNKPELKPMPEKKKLQLIKLIKGDEEIQPVKEPEIKQEIPPQEIQPDNTAEREYRRIKNQMQEEFSREKKERVYRREKAQIQQDEKNRIEKLKKASSKKQKKDEWKNKKFNF